MGVTSAASMSPISRPRPSPESQAHAVDRKEVHAVAQPIDTVDQSLHFLPCRNIMQRSGVGWFDDMHPLYRLAKDLSKEKRQPPGIHLDTAPGVVFLHPGEVGFQISGCEVVMTAVEVACDAAHGPGIAVIGLAPFALKLEGLQVLGIELVKSHLFVLFHGEVSPQGDERNGTHMRVCILHCGTARLPGDRASRTSPCEPAINPSSFGQIA